MLTPLGRWASGRSSFLTVRVAARLVLSAIGGDMRAANMIANLIDGPVRRRLDDPPACSVFEPYDTESQVWPPGLPMALEALYGSLYRTAIDPLEKCDVRPANLHLKRVEDVGRAIGIGIEPELQDRSPLRLVGLEDCGIAKVASRRVNNAIRNIPEVLPVEADMGLEKHAAKTSDRAVEDAPLKLRR